MTATMNTTPATMPTHAATAFSFGRRRRFSTSRRSTTVGVSAAAGAVVAVVPKGLVTGSGDEVVSLMSPIMSSVVMRQY
jgi:hypothetical protein